MSETPKKIWVDNTILCEFDMELCPESDVKYIRADLVDGLVEAVEVFINGKFDSDEFDSQIEMMEDALAALKALEE
jgi:hypothetical protein